VRNFIPEFLETYYDELTPQDFYRAIFPQGELEEHGKQEIGKYNAIAVELLPKAEEQVNARRHILTDDLSLLEQLLKSENFIIISPISYAGKSRVSVNARFIYAIAIDLDGITEEHYLRDLFHQMKHGILPQATYTIYSGTGIHLYYQLEKPIPCFKNIVKQLAVLKKALTVRIWNKYTTELYEKPQIESLFQGFRMVGGITKDKQERTRAFLTGEPVSIEHLNGFVYDEEKLTEYTYKSSLTLEAAKKKYPEWYQKRIVEGAPRGVWTTKKDLFYWWVSKIKSGAAVGHRYFCIMTLAIYAKKAGIDREELERTAFELVEPLDELTEDKENRFTREDVLAALEMYNDNYIVFPIDSIVNLTHIPIEKNKRNYRRQELHLKLARSNKAILKEAGEMKKEGRPSKEEAVKQWRQQNPNGSKAECKEQLSVSRSTVYKYWD